MEAIRYFELHTINSEIFYDFVWDENYNYYLLIIITYLMQICSVLVKLIQMCKLRDKQYGKKKHMPDGESFKLHGMMGELLERLNMGSCNRREQLR